jgi:hypothetical protein
MSNTKNTGGPAFPVVLDGETASAERMHPIVSQGMTLRDHFAGLAMQGIMSSETEGNGLMSAMQGTQREQWMLENAVYSYAWADAMIKAREQ